MPEDGVVFIGKKSTMAYVMAVTMQMNEKGLEEVTLKARGKAISRAVDVAEIVKNKFINTIKARDIKIYTEEVKARGEEEEPIKVSAMEITLRK